MHKVLKFYSKDIEFNRLQYIAEGAKIIIPIGFKRNPMPSDYRALHKRLMNTYRGAYLKLWKKGKGILLSIKKTPPEILNLLHFSDSHWTPKPDNKNGRNLLDTANGPENGVLNTDDGKEDGILRLGKVELPTIVDYINDWVMFCNDRQIKMDQCLLWKDDVEGAFPQLRFNPESICLLATRVDDEFVFIHTNGFFGLNYMPMIYSTVGRALDRRVSCHIKGVAKSFVDDMVGFSVAREAVEDQKIAQGIICDTFNAQAVNQSKSISPSVEVDVIGWTINLTKIEMCPNEKGINKLLLCFLFVDTERYLPLKVYQLLASLAERYSIGLKSLTPFVSPLHAMTKQARNHSKKPTPIVKFCIDMWRVVATFLFFNKFALGRNLLTLTGYKESTEGYITDCVLTISDAGPNKIGAALLNNNNKIVCFTSVAMVFEEKNKSLFNSFTVCR